MSLAIKKVDFGLQDEKIRMILQVVFASCLIGVCAQIRIPLYFSPIPITGQTFGVMLVAALLGGRRGASAVFAYLAQGILGLPVWAGGASGAHILFGASGGYLFGYILQAYLTGFFMERLRTFAFAKAMAVLLISSFIQMCIGTLWLSLFVRTSSMWMMGFYPFIPGEIVKAILATTVYKLWRL